MIGLVLCFCVAITAVSAVCKETSSLRAEEKAALDKHNELRALHKNTPDLCYGESGDDITFTSEAFAKHLTDTDSFEHSSEETSGNFAGSFGENLATKSVKGTALPGELEAYTWATQAWYDEISDWDFKNGIRKAGASGATGHFTQVVWQDSEQVNCGYASYTDPDSWEKLITVCQYFPPGNYVGREAEMVNPLESGSTGMNPLEDTNEDDESGSTGTRAAVLLVICTLARALI